MQETTLFGLTLIGALFVVMVVLTCALMVAFRAKTRELEERAAAAKQKKDAKVERICNRLILKVWSGPEEDIDETEKVDQQQVDLEEQQIDTADNLDDIPKASDVFEPSNSDTESTNSCQSDSSSLCAMESIHQSVCAICLGPYHDGELVVQSCNPNCHHEFHRECIAEWLAKKDECPCCRQRFLEKDEPINETN